MATWILQQGIKAVDVSSGIMHLAGLKSWIVRQWRWNVVGLNNYLGSFVI